MIGERHLENHRVLIIAPAWVGDMVMAQTLFKLIKQGGASHLAIVAPKWTLAVASRMPEVDEYILGNFSHGKLDFGERRRLGKSLIGQFDTAIILPKSLKSALLPFFAQIPLRIGYTGEMRYGLLTDLRKLDKQQLPKTIDRFAYLGSQHIKNIPKLENPSLIIDTKQQKALTQHYHFNKPLLALCPGAEYGPSKQWPITEFAAIAEQAITNGYQVIALGSPKDNNTINDIQKITPKVINLAGETSITDAIDLLALADAVVTNDSGLMHIAAAVSTPVFAIYGSTTPAMTPPLSANATIFADDTLSCRPCFKRNCQLKDDEFMACMRATPAELVWKEIQQTLSS